MEAQAKGFYEELAAERKLVEFPADPSVAAALASRYTNPAVGDVVVHRNGKALSFDFGELASDMASRKNPDGTNSLITAVPGFTGLEFVAGSKSGQRNLTLRDAQHEYVLVEKAL